MRAAGPVRVLHVVKGLGPGGAERLLVSMASVADTTLVHHEVAYLLPWKGHLVPELEAIAVPVHLLAGRRGMADPTWVVRLRRLARDFDVVHFHSPAVAAIARPVLRSVWGRPRLASTEHNVWGSHAVSTRLMNALTLPLDDVRWAVSEEVISSAWAPWRGKTEVLVHGIPREPLQRRRGERAHVRRAQGWAERDVVVTVVANMREHKDYPTLFEAAASALADEPRLRFVSIGQGPLEDELRALLRTWDLGDRFVMLGYHSDPAAVLAGSDVFTLSSRHEGLPISLLEAMALGLPPVVTAVGANAVGVTDKVVTDGVNGMVVDPGRPDLLAAAYVRLARDAELRKRVGDAAAARAVDFDISRTARIVEARYVALARRRNRHTAAASRRRLSGVSGRRVCLDVGGHVGETVSVAMEPRWGFDRLWTFEPTSVCVAALRELTADDDRVTVVPAGWWSSDTEMDIYDPGSLHASVEAALSRHGRVERCRFIDAASWMAENITPDDEVWLKLNVEASETEILGHLLDTGEIAKVDHLVVHFDVEKIGQGDKAVPIRARLDAAGVRWREASQVLFGRTDPDKIATWLGWTNGHRWSFTRRKAEHKARRLVWLARKRRFGLK